MASEIESPYFTGEDFDASNEFNSPISSNGSPSKTIDKLKKMFPDKVFHMKVLVKLYEFCFSTKQVITPVFEKTTEDVLADIQNTPISLNLGNMIREQTEAVKKAYAEEQLLNKRVEKIPMFIDFAYLYYIWCYDADAPIYKLPSSSFKFNMIKNALEIPADNLADAFAKCLEDTFIRDLRIEQPPFMMRTELEHAEIREKIESTVKPICKDILNGLFALEKNSRKSLPL